MDEKVVDIDGYVEGKMKEKMAVVAPYLSESFIKMDAKIDEAEKFFLNKATELLTQLGKDSSRANLVLSMTGAFHFILLVAREKSFNGEMNRILLDETVKQMAD